MVAVLLCFLIGYIIYKTKSKCGKKADEESNGQNKEEVVDAVKMPLQYWKQHKAQLAEEYSV